MEGGGEEGGDKGETCRCDAAAATLCDPDTFLSGEFKDTDRCCWKHKQCTGHVIHPFTSDYVHHDLHLHSISHCDCDSR